jgi:hypothetical protein
MKTQYDTKVRAVALENLKAMCAHISGTCHRYRVVKVTRSRVHVEYANPDEYGREDPIVAVYPCLPGFAPDNPIVIFTIVRVINDQDEDRWQDFSVLEECPTVFHDPVLAKWRTHLQIRKAGAERPGNGTDGCVVCDLETYRCKCCGHKWTAEQPVRFTDHANAYVCTECEPEPDTSMPCESCYQDVEPGVNGSTCSCGLFLCATCSAGEMHRHGDDE